MEVIRNILALIGAINLTFFVALLIFFGVSLRNDKEVYADPTDDKGRLVEQEREVNNDTRA